MMKRYFRFLMSVILMIAVAMEANASESADVVLKKAANAVNSSYGLTASFTLYCGGQKVAGTLKALGKKFVLDTSSSSTWYDGKTLWTYNPKNAETTITIPTASEVAEVNPLALVNTYSASFTASFAKTQKKGSKTIVLTPKSKKLGYRSVHLTISDATSMPTEIVVCPASGQKVTVTISNVNTKAKLDNSCFVYPKSKYPKAEIVDIR